MSNDQDVQLGALTIDIRQFNARLKTAQQSFQAFAGRLNSMGQQFSQVVTKINQSAEVAARGVGNLGKALGALGVAAGAGSVALIKLASDANEAASKFGFVFGKAAEDTGKKLDEFAKAAGRSKYELRDMASNIGALIGPMGFTEQATGKLSTQFAQLATDLSSFFNVTESDALMALRSAIVGESEPMRRFGVQLNEAKIQAEAFKLGIARSKAEVQGAIKTQAIFSIVMRETQQAQGDAIRTGDQFANSYRRMTSFLKDAATDIGQAFIPSATKLVRVIGDAAEPMKQWAAANQEWLTTKIGEAMEFAGRAAMSLYQTSVRAYQALAPMMQSVWQEAQKVYGAFSEWFESLPEGAQDVLKIVGVLAGLSTGLTAIGGSLPIVGGFASAIGALINPIGLVSGAIRLLLPLITGAGGLLPVFGLLFSPAGLVLAGVVALTSLVGYLRGDVAGTFKDVASIIDTTFGGVLKSTIDLVKALRAEMAAVAGADSQKEFDRQKIKNEAGDEGLAKRDEIHRNEIELQRLNQSMNQLGGGKAGGALQQRRQELLANRKRLIDEYQQLKSHRTAQKGYEDYLENFAEGSPTEAGKAAISARDKKESQRNMLRAAAAHGLNAAKAVAGLATGKTVLPGEQKQRDQAQSEITKLLSEGRIGEAIAKGQIEYERQHASEVALAEHMVATAAKQQPQNTGPAAGTFQLGAPGAGSNRQQLAANQQGMLRQAKGLGGAAGSAAQQAAGVIGQIGQQMAAAFQNFNALTEEQKTSAIQLHDTYQNLVAQFKAGTLTQEQFNKQVQAAGDAAKKLADSEEGLADLEEQRLNAQGKLSPRQQQAQQAAMEQFKQAAQQGLQQVQEMLKQGQEAQLQGAQQADEQLNAALNSGDPKQVAAALSALKGYAQAQIQQTLRNVANATGDAIQYSFGTMSQPGILPVNLQTALAQNPQAAATVKMFEALVASLVATENKLPKMASGGVVTSPTRALVGEAGPEAILPLGKFGEWFSAAMSSFGNAVGRALTIPMGTLNQLFGNPMGMFFPNNGMPLINPGGGSINPLGLSLAALGAFGPSFRGIAGMLNQQIDLGNTGALGLLQKWQNVQQAAEDALGWMRQRRSIDLGGNGPAGRSPRYAMMGANNPYSAAYNPFGGGSGFGAYGSVFAPQIHVHGVDITEAGAAQKFAQELLPALDNAVRYRGADLTGRRPNNYYASGRAPGTPSGYSSIR